MHQILGLNPPPLFNFEVENQSATGCLRVEGFQTGSELERQVAVDLEEYCDLRRNSQR